MTIVRLPCFSINMNGSGAKNRVAHGMLASLLLALYIKRASGRATGI
jgi:hypothetical protein